MKYEDLSFEMKNKEGLDVTCDITAVIPNPDNSEEPYVKYTDYMLDEDDNFILELKNHTKLPIIKAYNNYKYADYALFDNTDPGRGKAFNEKDIKRDKPFFLAGGISINNVDNALKLNPYAIDVSSSVETDGFKDELKIKEIIRKVRE